MSEHHPLHVLVCGATGNQGGAVAARLLERGHRVRALTRKPQSPAAQRLAELGAELAEGDFADAASLRVALHGVDALFLMATPYEAGIEAEMAQATAAIDAAAAAGIGHLVYSSGGSVDRRTGIPHFDSKHRIETHLRGSGLPFTIIGPVFFEENFLSPLWLPGLRSGRLLLALPPQRRIQMVSMATIAAFAVEALENRAAFAGQRFDIADDELSGSDVARIVSELSGRPIDYVEQPLSALHALGEDFATMFEWFDRVGYDVDIEALRERHPAIALGSFEGWAKGFDWRALLSPA